MAFTLSLLLCSRPSARAELKPDTLAAYQKYMAVLNTRMAAQNQSQSNYLWIDRDPSRRKAVQRGDIVTEQVKAETVPDGMIQHWIAGVFLPGATLTRVEQVDQDYASYSRIYAPDLTNVKVVAHDGSHFVVAYRITKTKVLTAVLDTVQAIDYQALAADRLAVRSHSQSVRQVDNAGKPNEHILPIGAGDGFLWAMDSFWRMQQRDGGVYLECEAITLSRGVPFGLGALVEPMLQSFAEDSLKKTIAAKRQAVAAAH